MNSWINLHALWKIVVIGLVAGAGLPALFAVGLRALAPRGVGGGGAAGGAAGGGIGSTARSTARSAAGSRNGSATGNAKAAGTRKAAGPGEAAVAEMPPDTLGKVIAGICFLAVIGAMVWGVYSIVHGS